MMNFVFFFGRSAGKIFCWPRLRLSKPFKLNNVHVIVTQLELVGAGKALRDCGSEIYTIHIFSWQRK